MATKLRRGHGSASHWQDNPAALRYTSARPTFAVLVTDSLMFRPLVLLCAAALLAACANEPPAPASAVVSKPTAPVAAAPAPLPANLRELTGNLVNVPAGASVELALLVIDERDRPQQLLGNITLQGTGQLLP